METYSFYALQLDGTTKYIMPTLEKIEAESMNEAIQTFERKHNVKEDSRERNIVWFVSTVDGLVFQYSIT